MVETNQYIKFPHKGGVRIKGNARSETSRLPTGYFCGNSKTSKICKLSRSVKKEASATNDHHDSFDTQCYESLGDLGPSVPGFPLAGADEATWNAFMHMHIHLP